MPYININGKNIFYNSTGTGEPLILLHNGFYSTDTWNNVREALSKHFYVIDYDRFGYGKSEKYTDIIGGDIVKQGVCELSSFIEKLKLKDVSFCGHCLGGAIALLYTAENKSNVKRVIAESVGYFSDNKLLLKADMTFTPFDQIPEELRSYLKKMHGEDYSKFFWELLCKYKNGYIMKPEYNIIDTIKKIKKPVFIINGDRDFYFDVEHPLKAYKKLKNSRLWIVPETGHDVHIESEYEFIRNVIDFLKDFQW